MPWTTRTYGSCGTGPNTRSLSCRDACFSTTTPNSACLRSVRWRRSQEPKSGRWRTTSPLRPMETKPHVRTSSLGTCQLLQELLWQQGKQSLPWYRCKQSHNCCYDGHFLSLYVCGCLPDDLLLTQFSRNSQQNKALTTVRHSYM